MSFTQENLLEAMNTFMMAFQNLSDEKAELERLKQEFGVYIAEHFSLTAHAARAAQPPAAPSEAEQIQAHCQQIIQQAVENISASQTPPPIDTSGHEAENIALKAEMEKYRHLCGFAPPGHFYSPIPSIETLTAHLQSLELQPLPRNLPGIDLNVDKQLELLRAFATLAPEVCFPAEKTASAHYYYHNHSFQHSDAILMQCLIRHFRPNRILEVGSGFSSFVTLDTNQQFFERRIRCEFIEPSPKRLLEDLTHEELQITGLYPQRFQDVDLAVFADLNADDILFLDTSHVSKLNSDVNHLIFNVLPVLKSGVIIHLHDIFFPFENSPRYYQWPAFWNECYLLRAFLLHNADYQILLWNDYLKLFHPTEMGHIHPDCLGNTNQSFWIQKR